jgi:hypothetical protein
MSVHYIVIFVGFTVPLLIVDIPVGIESHKQETVLDTGLYPTPFIAETLYYYVEPDGKIPPYE